MDPVKFSQIQPGDLFKSPANRAVYMKIMENTAGYETFKAVIIDRSTRKGTVVNIDSDSPVFPMEKNNALHEN